MGRIVRAAATYFAAVYAVGFALGAVRESFVRPRIGTLAAIALETPAMLLVSFLVARFVVRRFAVVAVGDRWRMGLAAFAMLMVAELAGSIGLRGMTPGAWLAHFAEPDGVLTLLVFLAFAMMPVVAAKGSGSFL